MRTAKVLAIAILMLAPFAYASTVEERNVAFLRERMGVTDESALVALASRAGERDLATLVLEPALNAVTGEEWHTQDIWILDVGPGPCHATIYGPGSPMFIPLDPACYVYEGDTAQMWQDSDMIIMFSWTMHTYSYWQEPSHWWAVGNTDHYCVDTATGHAAFPFLNGIAKSGAGYEYEG